MAHRLLRIVAAGAVAYGAGSYAVDRGSMLAYAVTIASLWAAVAFATETVKQYIRHKKK